MCCCCCCACKDYSLNSSSRFGSLQSFSSSSSSSSPPATFGILCVVTRPQFKIWRNVDASATGKHNFISLGMVDAKAVHRKLSKQLKIALEPHEKVRIFKKPMNHSELVGTNPLPTQHAFISQDDIPSKIVSSVRCGAVRCGAVRCGTVQSGAAQCSA